jgi:phosphopentomutase
LRAIICVLDSLGIGAAQDAGRFGDDGANTLGHIAEESAARDHRLRIPNLARLGLVHAAEEAAGHRLPIDRPAQVRGRYGFAAEQSAGKDTPSGHWEMMGLPVPYDWAHFDRFPDALVNTLIEAAKLPGILGNGHASGTTIIEELGEEHIATGKPIVYTSADSVLQIAAHEEHFGLERLYRVCALARGIADGYNIGRVIARPFLGEHPGAFRRTGNRKDLSMPPHGPTLLDRLSADGGAVIGIGKISDIFAGSGITRSCKADGNAALFDTLLEETRRAKDRSIVFANFVDFDTLYGHRRDPAGYAAALEAFDARLPALEALLADGDILVVTADHGCDPTWPGSDHTREYIPLILAGPGVKPGSAGKRETFADLAQSLAGPLKLPPLPAGQSFL